MKFDISAVRNCLKSFDFQTLFREHLGWDNLPSALDVTIEDITYSLKPVAQKRGFMAFVCNAIPDRETRRKIENRVTKSAREHFIIYADKAEGKQVWQWVRREQGKPSASRDHRFNISQSGDALIQKLNLIAVSIEEEEDINVVVVAGKVKAAFDVDKVTKKFYERFKSEHTAFLKLIEGIESDEDLQWYSSLMLNRLMFVYFIQKKGFLDGDTEYLRKRLTMLQKIKGKGKFHSFYRYFLLRLFHEGLGKSPDERKIDPDFAKLLGKVPFLNGGFFEVHELEERWDNIDILDEAFVKLFTFFDQYSWHLDERPLRADNEINPDVVGYIFEKYINQKQMGAYYTKEDITEYISKNTVIPFLFDTAKNKCAIALTQDSALWQLLRDDPDRYIYDAVRHGVIDEKGNIIPLPKEIEAGRADVSKRGDWNKPADEPYALPTETWREHVARRSRCIEIREKLLAGEVHEINDLITLNLDIWQFARDAITGCEGPELLRAFWHAIENITILDPTCGSGAFLFAALRIMETLYSDCLARMAQFLEDLEGKDHHPKQFSDFKAVLGRIAEHPSDKYFILKSIIINNLFGVDIMAEAVEICKLRLFLKLVAQVETAEQIEPLPDIDFNIRAGNTLVGFASLEQIKESMRGDLIKEKQLPRIEEEAELVERAFVQFREQQTTHGGKVTHEDKRELRDRLAKLGAKLDLFLAEDYGVGISDAKQLGAWKASHQPFHWLVEFYGIMRTGGFDVIIGNPPYVEYSKVKREYTVIGYETESCGNLYAFVVERSFDLLRNEGQTGMIVPVALPSTPRMQLLRDVFSSKAGVTYFASFADRPSCLFSGVHQILTIFLAKKDVTSASKLNSANFYHWLKDERPFLFSKLSYVQSEISELTKSWSKSSSMIEINIKSKIKRDKKSITSYFVTHGRLISISGGTGGYWLRAFDEIQESNEYKSICVNNIDLQLCLCAMYNSSLFYWLWRKYSDCRHLTKNDMREFLIDIDNHVVKELSKVGEKHQQNLKATIETRHGKMTYKQYRPSQTKPIIDEIDRVLAKHYGFTEEELDFIINYDIKYRMGGHAGEDEE